MELALIGSQGTNRVLRSPVVWLARAEPNTNKRGAEHAQPTVSLSSSFLFSLLLAAQPPLLSLVYNTSPFVPAFIFSSFLFTFLTGYLCSSSLSLIVMSATEAAAATPAVVVEEAKPTETAPVVDTPAPAQEAPKVEETATPVRFFPLC